MEILSLYPPLPKARPRFITPKRNVMKMLNIPTNIPNRATQILKLLWVVYGHTYANFMKFFLLAYTRKAGTSEYKLIWAWQKEDLGKKKKNRSFRFYTFRGYCFFFSSSNVRLLSSGKDFTTSVVNSRDEDMSELAALIGEHWWGKKWFQTQPFSNVVVYRVWLR